MRPRGHSSPSPADALPTLGDVLFALKLFPDHVAPVAQLSRALATPADQLGPALELLEAVDLVEQLDGPGPPRVALVGRRHKAMRREPLRPLRLRIDGGGVPA